MILLENYLVLNSESIYVKILLITIFLTKVIEDFVLIL